jgi:spore germination cell wall hydrolase CwlJ-like protein
MSVRGSKFVAGASICALGLIFAATNAQSGLTRSAARVEATPVEAKPGVETAPQRRERLNARVVEMLRSGEGARLVQPVTAPRRSTAPHVAVVAPQALAAIVSLPVDRAATGAASTDGEYVSTITPPSFTGGTARRAGRGYIPPRLDLTTAPRIPSNDVECLTQAVYYEAHNESADGQAAVAEVVMNRSRSGKYPRSVCAVVYQRNSRTCQFTFTCDGAIGRYRVDIRKWARAERIAREVYDGRLATLLPSNSVNYHATYVRPSWGARLERVRQVGAHIFYGAALGSGVTPGAASNSRTTQVASQGLMFVRIEALDRAFQAVSGAGDQAAANGLAEDPSRRP